MLLKHFLILTVSLSGGPSIQTEVDSNNSFIQQPTNCDQDTNTQIRRGDAVGDVCRRKTAHNPLENGTGDQLTIIQNGSHFTVLGTGDNNSWGTQYSYNNHEQIYLGCVDYTSIYGQRSNTSDIIIYLKGQSGNVTLNQNGLLDSVTLYLYGSLDKSSTTQSPSIDMATITQLGNNDVVSITQSAPNQKVKVIQY